MWTTLKLKLQSCALHWNWNCSHELGNKRSNHEEIKSTLHSGNTCYNAVHIFCLPVCYLKAYKDWNTQNYNLIGCFVWVWNLVSHIKGKHILSVFENRVLRGIFGPKREEVTEWLRKLRNKEVHNLYSSPAIMVIEIMKNCVDKACSKHGRHHWH
jgi:hypothetical protein